MTTINFAVTTSVPTKAGGGYACTHGMVRDVRMARNALKVPLTQDALSGRLARAGCLLDRSAIAKIESGLRGVSDREVVAFCRVLGVSPGWLLGLEAGSKGGTGS